MTAAQEPRAGEVRPNTVEGRLAARPWRDGDPLPEVGSQALVSGANADIESDQHRAYMRRTVIGYGEGQKFIVLQTTGCWPTVERTVNCWFAEIDKPLSRPSESSASVGGEALDRIEFILTDPAPGYSARIANARAYIAALRTQAPAREGEGPVAWQAINNDGSAYGEPKRWPPTDRDRDYHTGSGRTIQPLYAALSSQHQEGEGHE